MDLDSSLTLDLGQKREPTTWVAWEANTQGYPAKSRRRKGARGRVSEAEMATMVVPLGKAARREANLRPEQIEALRLKREPKDHSITCLEQEDGEGNIEYKLRIKDPHPVRLQQLITQLKFRLSEGNGECFYYIGVEDNGYPKGLEAVDLDGSVGTLQHMASSLGAQVTLMHYMAGAWGRRAALLRVAISTAQEACHTDLRIAVAGSVDAGKSTLVAVLTTGSDGRPALDNGRGLARMNVFRHKHEMQSGRTSSICHQLLGYDLEGRVINYATPAASALMPAEITGAAAKVLTFLDMGGHEKYLKTALYGMTALLPDYSLLCVCAAAGLGRIAREHLAVAVALEVPVAVIITKVELVRPERFAAVVAEVRQLVALTVQHESGFGQVNMAASAAEERRVQDASPVVTTEADALASARVLCQLHADSLASPTARGALRVHMPIFPVSAVTGAGLPVLHAFLNSLQPGAAPVKAAAVGVPMAAAGGSSDAAADVVAAAAAIASGASASGGAESSCGEGSSQCTSAGGTPRAVSGVGAAAVPFGGLTDAEAAAAAVAAAAAATGGAAGAHQLLYAPAAATPAVSAAAVVEAQAVHFQVDGTFEVEGVGSVVSGTLVSGTVRLGQELMLGPTAAGDFARVVVRQLQRSHVQVQQVRAGQTCTIAISPAAEAEALARGLGIGLGQDAADAAALVFGTSPGAAPRSGLVTSAAAGGAAALGVGGNAGAGDVAAAGGGGRFEDALAAAQTALELCLGLGSDDEAAGGGDEDLFAFDACDAPASRRGAGGRLAGSVVHSPARSPGGAAAGPASPSMGGTSSLSGSSPGGGSPGGVGGCILPLSMSVSQLHSTTSFCVGGAGPGGALGALSASAPIGRSLCVAAAGGGALAGPPRKGAVLLEPALQPRTSWTFEAVLILLGGHWPARGLLSGRWPPSGDDDLPAGALGSQMQVEGRPGALESASASATEVPGGSSGGPSERSGSLTPRSGVGGGDGTSDVGEAGGAGEGAGAAAVPMGEAGAPAAAAALARSGAVPVPGGVGLQGSLGKAGRRRRQRSAGGGTFVTVVHCGSVRQPAHVLMMQELLEDGLVDDAVGAEDQHTAVGTACCPELKISASTRAAAALLHSARMQQHPPASPTAAAGPAAAGAAAGGGAGHAEHGDLGCLVRVVLRWQHRPEWLREGAKLLVRDRCDGRVAGAGFVRRVIM